MYILLNSNTHVFFKFIIIILLKEIMREMGYLSQLQTLIYHSEESVQITALVALGNLALNKNNSKEMKVIYYWYLSLYNFFIFL